MVILGIESSCDETGIGILKNKKILANTVATQEELHSVYGGIVPELASRAHCAKIDNLFKLALKKSGLKQKNIDFIGVTSEPGLKGSLLVGVSFAAGLGYSLGISVYKINHLYAHIAANFLTPGVKFPALGLVVSGGHTSFFYIRDYTNFTLIGKTLDDACGETFDKVGRMLQLGFPGGPAIERKAKKGDEKKIKFPVALISKNSIDFSFSGLKTSVMYYIKENGLNNVPDICAGFQKAIADALVKKAEKAIKKYPVKTFFLGGGVTQNQYIVNKFKSLFKEKKVKLFVPPKKLCLDNGAMVAIMTHFLIAGKIKKPPQPLKIEVQPTKT